MNKEPKQYRVVKKYDKFFCEWYYELQIKVTYWLFGWKAKWVYYAGNKLDRWEPESWKEFNIVERITEEIC